MVVGVGLRPTPRLFGLLGVVEEGLQGVGKGGAVGLQGLCKALQADW